jgi:protein tyrosine phosphatase (PTP) superfamily phosphohydrolase (DUF442 family)
MKRALKIALIVLGVTVAVLAVPVWQYFPGHNFRVVEQGAFYGSRQMSGDTLTATINKYGVKTVVNCRGKNDGSPWYDEEAAACARAGVVLANFGWSRNSIPPPESLLQFLELLETGQKPFLAHCQGGTHRTGAAAAVYLLAQGKSPAVARGQFGPGFRGAPIGDLVTLYEQSGSASFKDWVKTGYPAAYAAWKDARKGSEKPPEG